MKPRAFSPKWRLTCSATAGFSLIELLIVLGIAGVMLTLMTGFFRTTVALRHDMTGHAEAQQGLRALISVVTQELRQAGACLPQQGQFIALNGVDAGAQDSLTLRIGRVNPVTGLCVVDSLTALAAVGDSVVTVADAEQFQAGDLVYITPNAAAGAFYTVLDANGVTLTLAEALVDVGFAYAAGTAVYALEERIYNVDTSTYGRPVLTVAIDGGSPQPLVDGVEVFDVQYVLGPCNPTCADVVSFPANAAEWLLVTEVGIKATVRSRKRNRDGDYDVATTGQPGEAGEYIGVKPRNFLRV